MTQRKPKMVGTVFPMIEAVIYTNGNPSNVLWHGFDAPRPIQSGLAELVNRGFKPSELTIRRGFYPGFGKPDQFQADSKEAIRFLHSS